MKTTLTTIAALALLLALASPAWAQTTTYASPVRIMNTPVPVNGTVTVTPQGGTMPVSGSIAITGTPQVAISGTPTVSLGTSGNVVRLSGTPFVWSATATTPGGHIHLTQDLAALPGSSAEIVEIETAAVRCKTGAGTRPVATRLTIGGAGGSLSAVYPLPLTLQGRLDYDDTDRWELLTPIKIYAKGGASIDWYQGREVWPGADIDCTVTLVGRIH